MEPAPTAAPDEPDPGAPPAASDAWQNSVLARIAQGEYAIRAGDAGLSAFNRAQGLRATFAADGVRVGDRAASAPGASDATVRLVTTSIGRAETRVALDDVAFAEGACRKDGALDEMGACLRRVEARHDGVVEWWENTPEGLEQGFDVLRKPEGKGALRIVVRLEAASARIDEGGQSATIVLPDGKRMSYGKLFAEDARKRSLPIRLVAAPDGLAIEVEDAEAAYPVHVDPLLATSNFVVGTAQAGANLGSCVASAGDVNGDGYGDVVVGAPSHDGAFVNGGKAYLFRGTASGLATTPSWTAEGTSANAAYGCPAKGAGDVNGDGYGDVVVAAPLHDNGQTDEGAVYLYRGSTSFLEASAAVVLERNVANARFGSQLVAAGDINGDGYGDIAVHASTTNEVTVYRGSSAPGLLSTPSLAYVVPASSSGTMLSAGDLNGDTFGDVVMVYSTWVPDHFGSTTSWAFSLGGPSGPGAVQTQGATSTETFAASMVGDVSGDGRADLVLSVYGALDGALFRGLCGGSSGFTFCMSAGGHADTIAPAGDVNGDGFADVLALTQAVSGTPAKLTVLAGGPPPSLTLHSETWVGSLPVTAGPAGDVDGDGYADAVVGVPGSDGAQMDQGAVMFYRGAPGALLATDDDQQVWISDGTGAHFGTSLAGLGDVNGDGYGDIAIAAPDYQGVGAGWAYLGSATGVSPTAVWSRVSSAVDGFNVSAAGDVDGDGYADLLVSKPRYYGDSKGWAAVYRGDPTAGILSTALWTLAGTQADAHLGEAIAPAGDLNGDGYADIAVGEPMYNSDGLGNNGRVHVYLGGPAGPGTPVILKGTCDDGRFGFALAGVHDMNGDTFDDLAVSSPWCSGGRVDVYGGAQSVAQVLQTNIRAIAFSQAEARFGVSIAGPGDVNGDRYADLLVGAHLFDNGSNLDTGRVALYYGGSIPIPDWVVTTTEAGARQGRSVGAAGDVNGDGLGDLIVGAPRFGSMDQGRAFVYLGAIGGPSTTASWTTASFYAQESAELGAAVSGAGDINGDGFSDVLIAAPLENDLNVDAGRVYVQYGNMGKRSTVGARFMARRMGTTTPIPPGGKTASTAGFDVSFIAKNPAGRSPTRARVQVATHGSPFGGWILYAYAPDALGGLPFTGYVPTSGYGAIPHFRARAEYLPSASAPWSLHSPWRYGGVLGDRYGVAVRVAP